MSKISIANYQINATFRRDSLQLTHATDWAVN